MLPAVHPQGAASMSVNLEAPRDCDMSKGSRDGRRQSREMNPEEMLNSYSDTLVMLLVAHKGRRGRKSCLESGLELNRCKDWVRALELPNEVECSFSGPAYKDIVDVKRSVDRTTGNTENGRNVGAHREAPTTILEISFTDCVSPCVVP